MRGRRTKRHRGDNTVDWTTHRQHLTYLTEIVPGLPLCTICGGCTGDEGSQQHEACKELARDGEPTPRIDTIAECGCGPCREGDRA